MCEINERSDWIALAKEHNDNLASIIGRFCGAVKAAAFRDHMEAEKFLDAWWLMEEAWGKAPDARWIHAIKGWGILCDLCSERYVLEQEEVAQ